MGKLSIINPGLYSSIQDLGRVGSQKYGVPVSGAMDQQNAQLANLLTHNPVNSPVIETTQIGPQLFFHHDAVIAITGADMSPAIDGQLVSMNKRLFIRAGQTLSFGKLKNGLRTYIGIHGCSSEFILGSFSQYEGITTASKLSKNDTLHFTSFPENISSQGVRVKPVSFEQKILEVYAGPELHLLSSEELDRLISRKLTICENDRMGYQLEPEDKLNLDHAMITAPVFPGTIQLTPSGRLLALMRDAQVTGGYPRLFQLTNTAINQLAQLKTGTKIKLALTKLRS